MRLRLKLALSVPRLWLCVVAEYIHERLYTASLCASVTGEDYLGLAVGLIPSSFQILHPRKLQACNSVELWSLIISATAAGVDKQDYELDRREHFVLILSTAFAAVVAVLLVVTMVGILKLDPAAPLAGTYLVSVSQGLWPLNPSGVRVIFRQFSSAAPPSDPPRIRRATGRCEWVASACVLSLTSHAQPIFGMGPHVLVRSWSLCVERLEVVCHSS